MPDQPLLEATRVDFQAKLKGERMRAHLERLVRSVWHGGKAPNARGQIELVAVSVQDGVTA